MNEVPETSVIIPTYNRCDFLREAIESVTVQTYVDYELIVIDDGSNDDTRGFVGNLSGGIRYHHQANRGPGAARNCGIKIARGEFLTFLDSDDLWLPEKLERQVSLMKRAPSAVVCYTDERWIRRGVRVNQRQKHRKYSGWIFEKCLPLCIVSPSSVLMRRSFFDVAGFFDEDLPACEDYDLWLRASLCMPFHFIGEELIIKRGGHADQLSSRWGLDVYRITALLKLLDNETLTARQRALVSGEIVRRSRILSTGFQKHGKELETEYYRTLADKYAPLHE